MSCPICAPIFVTDALDLDVELVLDYARRLLNEGRLDEAGEILKGLATWAASISAIGERQALHDCGQSFERLWQ